MAELARRSPREHQRRLRSGRTIWIARGSTGRGVAAIQKRLKIKTDGDFGPKTEKAVKHFQRRRNLQVDGIVGKQTLTALRGREEAAKVEPATAPRHRLRRAIQKLRGKRTELAGPSTAEREKAEAKGQAMPGGRFPIRNRSDLAKAIHAVGRATDSSGRHSEAERAKVRRFLIARAKALGAEDAIPSSWQADGSVSG